MCQKSKIQKITIHRVFKLLMYNLIYHDMYVYLKIDI